jgi:enoyl-CoA hydratase/carnithine racemase
VNIRLEHTGATACILIDRADKRNAFNQAMWELLPHLLTQALVDPAVRVIILRSATAGIFCAGADISELMDNRDNSDWRAANQAAINAAQFALARAAKPVIAFIDGDCIGGGCGLALACDIRIATSQARFGITPAKLGLVYPLHDTKLLVDLVGPGQAKRILFTGALLEAKEALRIGLIEDISESIEPLATAIAANSAHSMHEMKAIIRLILDGQTGDDAATLASFANAFSKADFVEGATAFLAKRKPNFL